MKAGKEPMRTFGDLAQFYEDKTVAPEDSQPPTSADAAEKGSELFSATEPPAAEKK